MSLTERISNPDRRAAALPVIAERREGEERRVATPRWLQWTRENQSRGKSLDSGKAA
jgi:hypothetical protein